MKQYPPRKHDKSKRVSRAGWPSFVLHSGSITTKGSPFRERKGVTTLVRPE